MDTFLTALKERPLLLPGSAGILILIGLTVLGAWHFPAALVHIHHFATLMAYQTALGFVTAGIGLVALHYSWKYSLYLCVGFLWFIGAINLLDLFTPTELPIHDWFSRWLAEPHLPGQLISPITSTIFLLAGAALWLGRAPKGLSALFASLISLLIILIAAGTMLVQSFNFESSYIWLGIQLAPHTMLGQMLFGIALINLRQHAAIQAFNRLNFFNRLVTGFVFMSLLFLGVGSIAIVQINNVAAISQQLYSGPVQVSNATLRIKAYVSRLNRAAKDIAVAPELIGERNLPSFINTSVQNINNEIALFEQQPQHELTAAHMRATLLEWEQLLVDIYGSLVAGDIIRYRERALIESQELTQQIEELCDQTIARAQLEMQALDSQALLTKHYAGNLMLVVMLGLLLTGILVAALITRSLSLQLQQLRTAMLALAQGDTNAHIPFLDHPEDVGDMAKTLKVFAQNIDERNKSTSLLANNQKILEITNHRLEQTNKELEAFAYVASHDLKSPLRGIAQLSTWIEEDLAEQQFTEVPKHTLLLRNRIQRMEKLLDDLLTFYRAGKTEGNLVEVDVAHMAKELFDIHNTKPGLRLELADNLPSFTTLSTPFEQVLRNFLSNAIKHHDREQGVIHIGCSLLPNHFYEFFVCDDGPGIPQQFQQRIFGMFQTLKPRDELEGSGMGLALIKKLVDNYGGHIRLVSEGRGSCFYFGWPQRISKGVKNES